MLLLLLQCDSLQWRHNGRDSVSNHQLHHCLLNGLIRRRSKKRSKLRVTDLCAGNSPVTGEFPAQMASNAENVCIWWSYHVILRRVWIQYIPNRIWCNFYIQQIVYPLQKRHNERDDVSNHQCLDCLLKCLFRRRFKKTSKLRVTGIYEGSSPVTG